MYTDSLYIPSFISRFYGQSYCLFLSHVMGTLPIISC